MSHEFDAYDIDELRRRVRGEVHGPGDPGYPSVGFNPPSTAVRPPSWMFSTLTTSPPPYGLPLLTA